MVNKLKVENILRIDAREWSQVRSTIVITLRDSLPYECLRKNNEKTGGTSVEETIVSSL